MAVDAQRLAELHVVFRLETEVGDPAAPPDLDVLRVVPADRRVGMGRVRYLQHLLPEPLLDRRELRLFLRDELLGPPRLGYEALSRLGVSLPTDALRQLVLLLPELVQLLHKLRTPVGEADDQVHVGDDAPVPAILGDSPGVLADVFEI